MFSSTQNDRAEKFFLGIRILYCTIVLYCIVLYFSVLHYTDTLSV